MCVCVCVCVSDTPLGLKKRNEKFRSSTKLYSIPLKANMSYHNSGI